MTSGIAGKPASAHKKAKEKGIMEIIHVMASSLGGRCQDRTADILLVRQTLSQLS